MIFKKLLIWLECRRCMKKYSLEEISNGADNFEKYIKENEEEWKDFFSKKRNLKCKSDFER